MKDTDSRYRAFSAVVMLFSAALGAFVAAFFMVRIVAAFTGPSQSPPAGSGVISVSGSNVGMGGNLNVSGTISGTYTGTMSAGNISAGTFGSNTGGGNYAFGGSLTAGSICLNGTCESSWPAATSGFSHNYGSAGYSYGTGYEELPDGFIIEWGSVLPNAGCVTAYYPIAFPNAALNIEATTWQSTDRIVYVDSYNNASALICNNGATSYANWMAIGY